MKTCTFQGKDGEGSPCGLCGEPRVSASLRMCDTKTCPLYQIWKTLADGEVRFLLKKDKYP